MSHDILDRIFNGVREIGEGEHRELTGEMAAVLRGLVDGSPKIHPATVQSLMEEARVDEKWIRDAVRRGLAFRQDRDTARGLPALRSAQAKTASDAAAARRNREVAVARLDAAVKAAEAAEAQAAREEATASAAFSRVLAMVPADASAPYTDASAAVTRAESNLRWAGELTSGNSAAVGQFRGLSPATMARLRSAADAVVAADRAQAEAYQLLRAAVPGLGQFGEPGDNVNLLRSRHEDAKAAQARAAANLHALGAEVTREVNAALPGLRSAQADALAAVLASDFDVNGMVR